MAVNPADLSPRPRIYQSSRGLHDVLIGEDTAIPLLNASSTGDMTALRGMLEQTPEIALESQHRIYSESRPAKDKNDERDVHAMKSSNLDQAIFRAAENGHATAVSTLLDFASRNGIEPSSVISRQTIKMTVENGHAAVFEVLAMAEPTVATFNINHGRRPLDIAIAKNNIDVARVILQQGGGREFPNDRSSRLCKAARFTENTMMELLLQHGYAVKGSGALHRAAEYGFLDTIRLLVEKHGADVNERLPAETLPRVGNALYASWTPMHFAATWGREEAMRLLESYGAKTDVVDVDGKTPSQLLTERKEASKT